MSEYDTILIGKERAPYQSPISFMRAAHKLEYLVVGATRELEALFKQMGLDNQARREFDNQIQFESDEKQRRQLRNINKGLTLELLTSVLFSRMDSPENVHARCSTTQIVNSTNPSEPIYIPHTYAQGGVDVEVDYPDFKIVIEVSSRRRISLDAYEKQIINGINHANEIRKTYDKPIYCLFVNERSVSTTENVLTVKDIIKKNGPFKDIYPLVMSIQEMAQLAQAMSKKYADVVDDFNSDDMHRILKKSTNSQFKEGLDELMKEYFDEALKNQAGKKFRGGTPDLFGL